MTLVVVTKILFGFLRIALQPLFSLINIIKIFIESKNDFSKLGFKLFIELCKLCGWLLGVIFLSQFVDNLLNMNTIVDAVAVLEQEGLVDSYASSSSNSGNSGGSGGGSLDINGTTFKIDINSVPNSVALPSGTYQNGTAKQRAELLIIVQEICARPEITISPEQLLRLFYVESTGNIGCSGSLVETAWPEVNNQYDCGGPFAIKTSNFNDNGCAFVCSLEDPTLSDSERVKTRSKCSNLKKIGGISRPSKFIFPDAAYTAALLMSWHYPASKCSSQSHWTIDMGNYAKNHGLDSYGIDAFEFNSALSYYNGFSSAAKNWIPAFYGDLILTEGRIDKWSSLSVSRGSLNNKLRNDLIRNIKRTLPDMESGGNTQKAYSSCLNDRNWESTQYAFIAHNGGKWIYDGLLALGKQIGKEETNTGTNNNTGGGTSTGTRFGSNTDGSMSEKEFKRIYSIAKKYYGKPYSLTSLDPPNHFCCANYVSYVFKEAGYKIKFTHSAQGFHDMNVTPITKEQLCPGDIIFFDHTYDGPNPITHVAIYLGNNKIAEAASKKYGVRESSLTPYFQSNRKCGNINSYGRIKETK